MEFIEKIKQFSQRVCKIKETVETEEATKMSLVVPLFQILGYDVFNSLEFCPEYTADVGIKKGEKVDYAILENGNPSILIECKSTTEALDKHASQLFRYFSTTTAKFGILTNGVIYKFYTDLEESNKMDLTPFLEIDMCNLKETQINSLKKFCKDNYDSENIFSTAEELKYTSLIKSVLSKEYDNPSEQFVKYILNEIYDGKKNQKALDKFTPVIKKAFVSFINEMVNDKISAALNHNSDESEKATVGDVKEPDISPEPVSKIITTEEELEAFYIIKGMFAGIIPIEDITYKDTESYFSILYKKNTRKPICRLNLDAKNKQIFIPDENKKYERTYIQSINELYKFKDQLLTVINRYINS